MKSILVGTAALVGALLAMSGPAIAASHREAPRIAQDPTADNTDFYAFRSWQDPTKVVFILNVIPGEEPSSGPNYFNFSDDVLYAVHVDTDRDGHENVAFEVRFTTEFRGVVQDLSLPLSYVALPPITALDGPGSEGLGLRQRYTVTAVGGDGARSDLATGTFYAVPSNVGPRTMPDYEALAARGIYALSNGGRVFAGQRDETFYIDLGATFDTLNFRRQPPILTVAEDASRSTNPFGVDMLSGFNVNSIAIEVPIASLGGNPGGVIGAYASTSRPTSGGGFAQVSRLANPLVNEVIIGTPMKDVWNGTDPADEATFLGFYRTSRLAIAINTVFGTSFPTENRDDLVQALLKYPGQDATCSSDSPCAELLRLDLSVSPTPPEAQSRLGLLGGDPAGWPNGRRPNDDVTDAALRVVAGALLGAVPALGDGVNYNIAAPGAGVGDGPGYGTTAGNVLDTTATGIAEEFPFLPTPHDGRDRRHIDCDEPDAKRCDEPMKHGGGSVRPTAPGRRLPIRER